MDKFFIRVLLWLLPFFSQIHIGFAQGPSPANGISILGKHSIVHDTIHGKAYAIVFPGLSTISAYNTVEGGLLHFNPTISSIGHKQVLLVASDLRYGFSDHRVKVSAELTWMHGAYFNAEHHKGSGSSEWSILGGTTIRSFNEKTPVTALMNSVQTLLYKHNYWKLYESRDLGLSYTYIDRRGNSFQTKLQWSDRIPLENTTDFAIFHKHRSFTPNYPIALLARNFERHQAAFLDLSVQHRKTFKVSLPNYKMGVQWAIPNFFGTDLDFSKWEMQLWDSVAERSHAGFAYRLRAGGFLHRSSLAVQDYFHFYENQVLLSSPYVQSFQLAPYYTLSTKETFLEAHLEQHTAPLNRSRRTQETYGMIQPVVAANILATKGRSLYAEWSVGLDQLFNLVRIDLITALQAGKQPQWGGRVHFNFGIGKP